MLKSIFDETNIPIVFTIDDNYAKYLSVSIQSIIDNSSIENNYDIIILSDSITKDKQKIIVNQCSCHKNISIRFYEISKLFDEIGRAKFCIDQWFSIIIYFRIYLPKVLTAYTKCVYLDCDIIVDTDIANLFNIDIGDNYLAATQEISIEYLVGTMENGYKYYQETLGFNDPKKYFQAGVMILDLAKLRVFELEEKVNEYLKVNPNPKNHDQDLLNALLHDKCYRLNLSWNFAPGYYWYDVKLEKVLCKETYKMYLEATKKPKIIHFTGKLKPWHSNKYVFSNVFYHYALRSPYGNEIEAELLEYKNSRSISSKITVGFAIQIIKESSYAINTQTVKLFGVTIFQIKSYKEKYKKQVKLFGAIIYTKLA